MVRRRQRQGQLMQLDVARAREGQVSLTPETSRGPPPNSAFPTTHFHLHTASTSTTVRPTNGVMQVRSPAAAGRRPRVVRAAVRLERRAVTLAAAPQDRLLPAGALRVRRRAPSSRSWTVCDICYFTAEDVSSFQQSITRAAADGETMHLTDAETFLYRAKARTGRGCWCGVA